MLRLLFTSVDGKFLESLLTDRKCFCAKAFSVCAFCRNTQKLLVTNLLEICKQFQQNTHLVSLLFLLLLFLFLLKSERIKNVHLKIGSVLSSSMTPSTGETCGTTVVSYHSCIQSLNVNRLHQSKDSTNPNIFNN